MATAKGITSKPSLTRVSAGVYKDANGRLVQSTNGSSTSSRKAKEKAPKEQSLQGLTKGQNANINQVQNADYSLGQTASGQLQGINDAYSQPFDWGSLGKAPWEQQGDIKQMSQTYQDEVYNNFARNAEPQFQKQQQDFEQSMANQGIPVGSKLYNEQKKMLMDTQENQRQNIRTNALTASDSYATNWNNMGTQNYQNAYTFGQARRNQPLQDYNALMGSRSGFDQQNLGYSQGLGAAKYGADQQIRVANSVPRGGGGGGGGGAGPAWAQYGFSSPQELDQYKINQQREQLKWEQDQARKNQPNPWYSLGGEAIKGIAGGLIKGWIGGS